jgi:hypothetical protein
MTKRTTKQAESKPAPIKVVALTDQMEAAKQTILVATRSEDAIPVPDVMVRAIGDTTDDTLLTVWRAWDIYAVHTKDGWMTRPDRVR